MINVNFLKKKKSMSVTSKSRVGNWSLEVSSSAMSWLWGSGLLTRVRLDGRDELWLNGTVDGRCLHGTAGYTDGKSSLDCKSL